MSDIKKISRIIEEEMCSYSNIELVMMCLREMAIMLASMRDVPPSERLMAITAEMKDRAENCPEVTP